MAYEPMNSHAGDSRCICTDGLDYTRDTSECCVVRTRLYDEVAAPPDCWPKGARRLDDGK